MRVVCKHPTKENFEDNLISSTLLEFQYFATKTHPLPLIETSPCLAPLTTDSPLVPRFVFIFIFILSFRGACTPNASAQDLSLLSVHLNCPHCSGYSPSSVFRESLGASARLVAENAKRAEAKRENRFFLSSTGPFIAASSAQGTLRRRFTDALRLFSSGHARAGLLSGVPGPCVTRDAHCAASSAAANETQFSRHEYRRYYLCFRRITSDLLMFLHVC